MYPVFIVVTLWVITNLLGRNSLPLVLLLSPVPALPASAVFQMLPAASPDSVALAPTRASSVPAIIIPTTTTTTFTAALPATMSVITTTARPADPAEFIQPKCGHDLIRAEASIPAAASQSDEVPQATAQQPPTRLYILQLHIWGASSLSAARSLANGLRARLPSLPALPTNTTTAAALKHHSTFILDKSAATVSRAKMLVSQVLPSYPNSTMLFTFSSSANTTQLAAVPNDVTHILAKQPSSTPTIESAPQMSPSTISTIGKPLQVLSLSTNVPSSTASLVETPPPITSSTEAISSTKPNTKVASSSAASSTRSPSWTSSARPSPSTTSRTTSLSSKSATPTPLSKKPVVQTPPKQYVPPRYAPTRQRQRPRQYKWKVVEKKKQPSLAGPIFRMMGISLLLYGLYVKGQYP